MPKIVADILFKNMLDINPWPKSRYAATKGSSTVWKDGKEKEVMAVRRMSRLGPRASSPLRQSPRLRTNKLRENESVKEPALPRRRRRGLEWGLGSPHLSFAIGREVDGHADQVVESRVGALVQEDGGQGCEREDS